MQGEDRRLALRLLAEVAAHRRPGGADRFAQRLGRVMAVAQLDRDRIGVDDLAPRDSFGGQRERGLTRRRVGVDGGAREVFGPAAVGVLEHDDAVGEPIGGDDLAHEASISWRPRLRSMSGERAGGATSISLR